MLLFSSRAKAHHKSKLTDVAPKVTLLTDRALVGLLSSSRGERVSERRAEPRYSFFAPVIMRPVMNRSQQFTAFSREVSRSGIGLLLNMPVEPSTVYQLRIDPQRSNIETCVEVMWSKPAGEGWYLCGCRFVTLDDN